MSLFILIGWIRIVLGDGLHGCTFILRGVVPIIKISKGRLRALLAVHHRDFIFPWIYCILSKRGLDYFNATDPKSTKAHETLGISSVTMQIDLWDSLQFESDWMDRNFELNFCRIDYSHPLTQRKILYENIGKQGNSIIILNIQRRWSLQLIWSKKKFPKMFSILNRS